MRSGVTDLAPALYLDYAINGFESERFEHVVVDEAQDVSPLEIELMKLNSSNSSFTILGDLRQGIPAAQIRRKLASYQKLVRTRYSLETRYADDLPQHKTDYPICQPHSSSASAAHENAYRIPSQW